MISTIRPWIRTVCVDARILAKWCYTEIPFINLSELGLYNKKNCFLGWSFYYLVGNTLNCVLKLVKLRKIFCSSNPQLREWFLYFCLHALLKVRWQSCKQLLGLIKSRCFHHFVFFTSFSQVFMLKIYHRFSEVVALQILVLLRKIN